MNMPTLPDPLRKTVDQISETQSPLRYCIESGDYVRPAAFHRSSVIAGHMPECSVSRPKALLLVPEQIMAEMSGNAALCRTIHGICISEHLSPKENLRELNRKSKIAVMTPSRAIDHLRRDNIDLGGCSHVIVLHAFDPVGEPSDGSGELDKQLFFDDCRFIFTKIPQKSRIEVYCPTAEDLSRDPEIFLEEMKVIPISSWYRSPYPITQMIVEDHSPARILDILYALGRTDYVIILGDSSAKGALLDRLGTAPLPLNCTVITCNDISTLEETHGIESVTVVPVGVDPEELTDIITRLFTWNGTDHVIVTLLTESEAKEITMRKETLFMDQEKKLAPTHEEITAGKLQLLSAKVKVDANPEELEELKKTFRKNVSFTQRANVTAFLLREYLKGNSGGTAGGKKPARQNERTAKPKKESPKASASKPVKNTPAADIPEGARTLYINIGKMRRLYAKELSQVFQDTLSISRDDIYSVRVHDKYSFVTLKQEDAEKAIELLNGKEIRGRVASVSYSNKE